MMSLGRNDGVTASFDPEIPSAAADQVEFVSLTGYHPASELNAAVPSFN